MADFARKSRQETEPEFLPPEPGARRPVPVRRFIDVSDADFVVISNRTSTGPTNDNQPDATFGKVSIGRLVGKLVLFAVRLCDRGLAKLSGQAFATLTGLAALAVFTLVIGLGAARQEPSRAAIAAEPLAIAGVSSHMEMANGLSLLVVTGRVENRDTIARIVPRIRLALGNPAKPDKTAEIVPMTGRLAPGEAAAFRVRINQPGGKPSDIQLSFASPAGSD